MIGGERNRAVCWENGALQSLSRVHGMGNIRTYWLDGDCSSCRNMTEGIFLRCLAGVLDGELLTVKSN